MLHSLSAWISRVIPDLYAPQDRLADGPYTRFSLNEGTIVVILSAVWGADHRPHLCHVSFTPRRRAPTDVQSLRFFEDKYVPKMDMYRRKAADRERTAAWTLIATDDKANDFRYDVDHDQQHFDLRFDSLGRQLKLDILCTDPTPYSLFGPLWLSRFFPLPSKWHVFSTRSVANVRLSDVSSGATLLQSKGLAHQEKNFGETFPTAWIWGQAMPASCDTAGSLVFAGGTVAPGLRSLFCALRSPAGRAWNFGPASTIQLAGWGPGMRLTHDSHRGSVSLVLTDWLRGRRVRIRGHADPSTFVSMAAPMPEGHRAGYCFESFDARYQISLEEVRFAGLRPSFRHVEEVVMEDGAPLEFGGDWSHFEHK